MSEEKKGTEVSRRQILTGAGVIAAGTAASAIVGTSFVKSAEASAKYPWPYKKLNINQVGEIAYKNYFTDFCAMTVLKGLFTPLRKSVGGPYKDYPLAAVKSFHGGVAGWGTVCGTLLGAGTAIGLIAGPEHTEAMTNDMMFYYGNTTMPMYTPKKAIKVDIKHHTKADTPVCHVSVGKWMKAADVIFLSPDRAERCARVAADIAMQTARLLNDLHDGKYKPSHKPLANVLGNGITSQNNCDACHGNNIPDVPGGKK